MKLHILSDLHIEFEAFGVPDTDADVVILAGDIHTGKRGINWILNAIPDKPVIYVLGNHEYYGRAFPKHIHDLKALTEYTHIHVLEKDEITIDDVTFLGCTLWTNFSLFGNDPKLAGYQATQGMNDYQKIRVSPQYRKLRSLDTFIIHNQSIEWLKTTLETASTNNNKTVVITHHAPSDRSLPSEYREDILSTAYASHLDEIVEASGAKLWIHGHIHTSQDYHIGNTSIICNPRGYPDERNSNFIPNLVIEV